MRSSPRALSSLLFIGFALASSSLWGAITITGVTDKTKYADSITFTVAADPNAVTTTATLDGVPVSVGVATAVNTVQYHELRAESRDGGGAIVDSKLVRFIVTASSRAGTEDGIPPHTPFRTVNDAPSAFAGSHLKVIAPAAWPIGLPIPIVAALRSDTDEPVRLNGVVTFQSFPKNRLQIRRGWGSITLPAIDQAGLRALGSEVNGLSSPAAINFEAAPLFTDVSGTIASDTNWAPELTHSCNRHADD